MSILAQHRNEKVSRQVQTYSMTVYTSENLTLSALLAHQCDTVHPSVQQPTPQNHRQETLQTALS